MTSPSICLSRHALGVHRHAYDAKVAEVKARDEVSARQAHIIAAQILIEEAHRQRSDIVAQVIAAAQKGQFSVDWGEHHASVNAVLKDSHNISSTNSADNVETHTGVPQQHWLPVNAIVDHVNTLLAPFNTRIPVLVHDTVAAINPAWAQQGTVVSGVMANGTIHLFRDGLPDQASVTRTLFHELLHAGLQQFLSPRQYTQALNKLYARDPWIREQAKTWLASEDGIKLAETATPAYARARGVDEALAHLAESMHIELAIGLPTTRYQQTLQAVRAWVARLADSLGFHEAAQQWRATNSQSDASRLIADTFNRLRHGEEASADNSGHHEQAQFSRQGGTLGGKIAINGRVADLMDVIANGDTSGMIPEAYRELKQIGAIMDESQLDGLIHAAKKRLQRELGSRKIPTPKSLSVELATIPSGDRPVDLRAGKQELLELYLDGIRQAGVASASIENGINQLRGTNSTIWENAATLSDADRLVLAGDANRAQIVSTLGEHLQPALEKIWVLDQEAQIGFRGSLASGVKGPHKLSADKGPVAFDGEVAFKLDRAGNYKPYSGPQGYDADYFVVSDKLAADSIFSGLRPIRRNVTLLDESLNDTFSTIHQGMINNPVLTGMKQDPLEFIIRTQSETNKLLNKAISDPQYYFIKLKI